MTGGGSGSGAEQDHGIVQMAIEDVFRYIDQRQAVSSDPREYTLRVSFMEIYNETMYDLLQVGSKAQYQRMKRTRRKTELK